MSEAPSQLTLAAKRLLDIIGSIAGLVLLSPLLVALVVLVRYKLGSPIFSCQVRAGKDGRPFRVWKFRRMTDARSSSRRLLPDRDRLTPFGTFLRSYSLDQEEFWGTMGRPAEGPLASGAVEDETLFLRDGIGGKQMR